MNRILLIGFLLVNCVGFGQSKRAVNKQLRQELEVEEHEYFSLHGLYYEKFNRIEELRDTIFHLQLDYLLQLNSDLATSYDKLNQTERTLRSLGVNVDSLISLQQLRNRDALNYRPLLKEFDRQLYDELAFRETGYMMPREDEKMKVQNDVIANDIQYYRVAKKQNDSIIREITRTIPDLEDLRRRLEVITQLYKNKIGGLAEAHEVLQRKLLELEDEFMLKGTKAFAFPYRETALHLFPLAAQGGHVIQSSNSDSEMDSESIEIAPEVYDIVEEYAQYPGGSAALYAFLRENLVYPQIAKEIEASGKCYLRFVVSVTGEVSNIRVMRGVPNCSECDQEAIRVLKLMPKWKPGKFGGKPVNSYFNIPIVFNLTDK